MIAINDNTVSRNGHPAFAKRLILPSVLGGKNAGGFFSTLFIRISIVALTVILASINVMFTMTILSRERCTLSSRTITEFRA